MNDAEVGSGVPDGVKHCICDNVDYSIFMIGCDQCERWYHGACMNITPQQSKRIKKYYCIRCTEKDSTLVTVYKKEYKKHNHLYSTKRDASTTVTCTDVVERCGECIGCFRTSDCEKCENCTATERKPCIKRKCVQVDTQASAAAHHARRNAGENVRRLSPVRKTEMEPPRIPKKRGRKRKIRPEDEPDSKPDRKYKRRHVSVSDKKARVGNVYTAFQLAKKKGLIKPEAEEEEPRQCYGPDCTKYARKVSKYCSDECGIALAELRVKYILTGRVIDYFDEQPAQDRIIYAKKQALDDEETRLNDQLGKLNVYATRLEKYITMVHDLNPKELPSTKTSADDFFAVPCPICNAEVQINTIAKHSQRCYIRAEKQMNFGSADEIPVNPNNIICNTYGKTKGSNVATFCRRLRVMCPEHYKSGKEEERKVGRPSAKVEDDRKICGCPLLWTEGRSIKEIFLEPEHLLEGKFCMNRRSACDDHNNWAQEALGLVDNERMNIHLKLDEIAERNRQLSFDYQARDVLSLLCNWRTPGPAAAEAMEKVCGLPQIDTYQGPDKQHLLELRSAVFPSLHLKKEATKKPVDKLSVQAPADSSKGSPPAAVSTVEKKSTDSSPLLSMDSPPKEVKEEISEHEPMPLAPDYSSSTATPTEPLVGLHVHTGTPTGLEILAAAAGSLSPHNLPGVQSPTSSTQQPPRCATSIAAAMKAIQNECEPSTNKPNGDN